MQTQKRLLDDLARVASGAIGVATEMRGEVEAQMRAQFERALSRFDLVTREEFDAVKAMAVKAREEQEDLAARLAALEASLATSSPPAKPRKTGGKTGARKAATGARGAASKGD